MGDFQPGERRADEVWPEERQEPLQEAADLPPGRRRAELGQQEVRAARRHREVDQHERREPEQEARRRAAQVTQPRAQPARHQVRSGHAPDRDDRTEEDEHVEARGEPREEPPAPRAGSTRAPHGRVERPQRGGEVEQVLEVIPSADHRVLLQQLRRPHREQGRGREGRDVAEEPAHPAEQEQDHADPVEQRDELERQVGGSEQGEQRRREGSVDEVPRRVVVVDAERLLEAQLEDAPHGPRHVQLVHGEDDVVESPVEPGVPDRHVEGHDGRQEAEQDAAPEATSGAHGHPAGSGDLSDGAAHDGILSTRCRAIREARGGATLLRVRVRDMGPHGR